eukprot:CAMPEP_0197570012 /NCGR_PEP_ID=MMETSP1320-20131121/39978_1 /TAXON_ID=91990 /ORGANISM="Bolidomonas sp., Strain RCC2347" /LENGTH=65 /DNA_ID=CAMNT_0043132423 /DNA_START=509 /DNA_END=703 /DNA_ORIENTATION=+
MGLTRYAKTSGICGWSPALVAGREGRDSNAAVAQQDRLPVIALVAQAVSMNSDRVKHVVHEKVVH